MHSQLDSPDLTEVSEGISVDFAESWIYTILRQGGSNVMKWLKIKLIHLLQESYFKLLDFWKTASITKLGPKEIQVVDRQKHFKIMML